MNIIALPKKRYQLENLIIIGLFILLFIPFAVPKQVQAKSTDSLDIKVGFYENSPKIYKINDNNHTGSEQYTGFFPELINYIAEQEGWSLTYIEGTWSECLDRLYKGEIDVLPDVGFSAQRAALYNFSREPVLTDWAYIYTLDNSTIQTFEELRGKKIAVMKDDIDYIGPSGFLNISTIFQLDCTIMEFPDLFSVFESIANGTVDAGVANGLFGNRNAYKYHLQRTILSFNKIDFKFAFPKNGSLTDIIAPIIDEWVINLKNDENSVYYTLYDEFIASVQESDGLFSLPIWGIYIFFGLTAATILFFTISLTFRYQVKKKTYQLHTANKMIKGISDNLVNGFIYQVVLTNDKFPPKYTYISADIEKMLGIKPEIVLNDPFIQYKLMHPDDLPRFMELEKKAYQDFVENKDSGKKIAFFAETRFIIPDGTIRWLQITSTPQYGDKDQIIWNGVALDITDRKKAEQEEKKLQEQLHQSQKLDALGQLAGGIAHDFNNVLASIIGLVELIKIEDDKEKQEEYLNTILSVAKKTGELTKNLLTFARKEVMLKKPVNIITILSETIKLLRHTIDKSVSISVNNDAENIYILGDENNLQNLFINLGINASQAMPNGGILDFEIKNVFLDEKFCQSSPYKISPGEYIKISVIDTGFGIPPEILDKIFDPFFTTKPKSEGTGLGLTLVHSIIKSHNGALKVYSQIDKGSVFEVYLPISANISLPFVQEKESDEVEIRPSTQLTILLIDDEEPIRLVMTSQLERLGYHVICAENGAIGIEKFREFRDKISLIILDVIMPIMGGKECLSEIRKIDPDISVIISSGYSKKEEFDELQKLGIMDVLQKPFEISDLIFLLDKWHKKQN